MGTKESIFDMLNNHEALLEGKYDQVLGEGGYTIFNIILQQPCTANNVSVLKYLHAKMPEKFPYRKEFLAHIKRLPPGQWLETLIQIYGTNVRDARVDKSYEHMLQGLINLNWVEGVEYLLQQAPGLVNIAVIEPYNQLRQRVYPLLVWVMRNDSILPSIVDVIEKFHPNLSLKDSDLNNIYHIIAIESNKTPKTTLAAKIEQYALENASPSDVLALNNMGNTPARIAEQLSNNQLAAKFKAIQRKAVNPEEVAMLKYYEDSTEMSDNVFSDHASLDQNKTRHFDAANAMHKVTPSDIYFCSLAGKALSRENADRDILNTRLFLNFECFYEYLLENANYGELPAIVNGIVIGCDGAHAVNVYCTIFDKTHIKAVVIDGLLLEPILVETEDLMNKLQAKGISFEPVILEDKLQFTSTGCRVISSYLASKLSHLSIDEAKELTLMLASKAVHDHVKLKDFPLNLGLLTICASMSTIERVKRELPEGAFDQPVSHREDPETQNQVLRRGMFHQYRDYVAFDQNKMQNQALLRKIQNQKAHAELYIECLDEDPDRAIEAVATLLGIKEMCEDWKSVTMSLIGGEEAESWESLQEFTYSKYQPDNADADLRSRQTNSDNPEAGAGPENSGPTL